MKYIESLTDFFKSPKWLLNLLLAGLCAFIPIVGPMVLLGWLITGFWGRPDPRPETFPDFDFSHFGKWLERGLWPFLVALVAGMGIYLVMIIPMMLLGVAGSIMGSQGIQRGGGGAAGALGAGMLLLFIGGYLVMLLAMIFVVKPLMLRASLTQDFGKAFDFAFLRRFVSLVWVELLLSTLFVVVASWLLMVIGMMALCVGVLFVNGVVYYMMCHLDRQLYHLYLSRGGEPVPLSPKLSEAVV